MEASIESAIMSLNHQIRKLEIQVDIIRIIKEICREIHQEFRSIQPQTRLSLDLDFESLELIQLILNLEKKYKISADITDILMRSSRGKEDITIEEIVNLIESE
jgi:acyl carrier protein